MKLNTKYFGEMDVAEKDMITFDEGIPGFENMHKFAIFNNYDTEEPVPFMWLQSMEDPELAFVISIPFFLRPDYEVEIPEEAVQKMEIASPEEVGVYTICRISGKVEDMMFNLRNPIVVNSKNHKAMQIMLNDIRYSSKEMMRKI